MFLPSLAIVINLILLNILKTRYLSLKRCSFSFFINFPNVVAINLKKNCYVK